MELVHEIPKQQISVSFAVSDVARKKYKLTTGEDAPKRVSFLLPVYAFPSDIQDMFLQNPQSTVGRYDFDAEVGFCEPEKQCFEKLIATASKGIRHAQTA